MKKRRKDGSSTMFGKCPLCQMSFPLYKLERHAADCSGTTTTTSSSSKKAPVVDEAKKRPRCHEENKEEYVESHTVNDSLAAAAASVAATVTVTTISEPLPGLFLYEDFITEEEEAQILAELDGVQSSSSTTASNEQEYLPWKPSSFNGKHLNKRWGVHCNLRDRIVSPAEHALPQFCQTILLPKLAQLQLQQQQQQQQQSLKRNSNKKKVWTFDNFIPNEANAIDYRFDQVHYLKDHVDDRQLSKEPIANISMAGDCYMTFTNVKMTPAAAAAGSRLYPRVQQVFLPRRCLQILTGQARYDYSHGIQHCHLLSPRRVSVTMRESPLTATTTAQPSKAAVAVTAPKAKNSSISSSSFAFLTARQAKKIPPTVVPLRPVSTGSKRPAIVRPWTEQPIPGLYLFHDFITPEEELAILQELDRPESSSSSGTSNTTWKTERHSGTHLEKRWGMDHDLWNSRAVRPPKHPLPNFMETIIIPKLQHQLPARIMQFCIPNEVNSIDYRRRLGHSLKLHADDRHKYKEPIANVSLAGDCIMTYRKLNESSSSSNNKNHSSSTRSLLDVSEKRVLLQRRCLQVLTGKARYDYAHGIANQDLLSDRRVSLTMRQVRP
jgi:alkylated DNA repair dioxygenase AlkB